MTNSFEANKNQVDCNGGNCQSICHSQVKVPKICFFSREEQMRLHHVSYQYRYGCFVRLSLYTGIRLGELLALRWEDVDMYYGLLYIRRVMYRVPKKIPSENPNESNTEIVPQAPKEPYSIRNVPLPHAAIQELMKWKEVQWNDRIENGAQYQDNGFIVTDPQGNLLNPNFFLDQFMQMQKAAGLGLYNLHSLRTTFAVRAVEQGMNLQALSVLMGYSTGNLTPLGELLPIGEGCNQKQRFPVALTPLENGYYGFRCPDFPEIDDFAGPDIPQGLLYMKENMEDGILISPLLYEPEPASDYLQKPGEIWLDIFI